MAEESLKKVVGLEQSVTTGYLAFTFYQEQGLQKPQKPSSLKSLKD